MLTNMDIHYDPEVDTLDIIFKKGTVSETREIGKEMFLDMDKKGNPLSLEILDAGKRLPKNSLHELTAKFSPSTPISGR